MDFVQAKACYHHSYHGKFYVTEGIIFAITKNLVGRHINQESADSFDNLSIYIESETELLSLKPSKNDWDSR